MKKYFNLSVILAVLAMFTMASCNDDDEVTKEAPKLEVSYEIGDVITFTVKCNVIGIGEDLKSLTVYLNGQPAVDVDGKAWTGTDSNTTAGELKGKSKTQTIAFDKDNVGKTFKFTLTDKDGLFSVQEVTVKAAVVEPETTPLVAIADFTLGRPGAADAPAALNGITWASNPSATEAKFTGDFAVLDKVGHDTITTKETLASVYAKVQKTNSLTVESDAKFTTQYFIVKNDKELLLVTMNSLKFVANANRAGFSAKK